MSSANPIPKFTDAAKDFVGSIEDNTGVAARIGAEYLLGAPVIAGAELGRLTAKRTVEDQRDQARAQADRDLAKARSAEAAAIDASVKELDPLALERRRRAALATNNGRGGTILTAGSSLGSVDVSRKTLLGL